VPFTRPEPLDKRHLLDAFESGEVALDEWLRKYARAAQASGSARIYVTTTDDKTVAGYYALAAGQVRPVDATGRVGKRERILRPIPVVLLARLAVDKGHQGHGLGTSLLQDAVLRSLLAAEFIGARAMLIHAKHNAARAWYEQYGFERPPTDPFHLMLLMKDLRAFADRSNR